MDDKKILEWLAEHGLTIQDYETRMMRDGEVFMGPDGFVDPGDIEFDTCKDAMLFYYLNKKPYETFISVPTDDEPPINNPDHPLFPVYEKWLNEEIEAGRLPPSYSDIVKMSESGLRGAEAGRVYRFLRWITGWIRLIVAPDSMIEQFFRNRVVKKLAATRGKSPIDNALRELKLCDEPTCEFSDEIKKEAEELSLRWDEVNCDPWRGDDTP